MAVKNKSALFIISYYELNVFLQNMLATIIGTSRILYK